MAEDWTWEKYPMCACCRDEAEHNEAHDGGPQRDPAPSLPARHWGYGHLLAPEPAARDGRLPDREVGLRPRRAARDQTPLLTYIISAK